MRRITYLLPRPVLLFLMLALMLASFATPRAQAADPIDQMRAFWVDSLNPGFRNHPQVDELIDNVVRANANTVFVEMRRRGNSWYNNTIDPRTNDPTVGPADEFDPLAYLLEKAHSQGVKVHAWLVISVTCSAETLTQPGHVCAAHGQRASGTERWTSATYNGTQVGDLDWGHPGAMVYMESVVQDLLAHYPALDGVHYDYVRYSGQSYGYNQVSVGRFNEANGRPAGSRPAPNDPAWSQWRRDRITELVRRLYIRIKAVNPQIQVSAATITWGGLGSYNENDWPNSAAYAQVFQDWRSWLNEGILDFAVPMHYFGEASDRTRNWYNSWLAWDRWNTGRRAIVVGTGAWLSNADGGIAQIGRALAPDAQGRTLSGVSLFSYNQPLARSNPDVRRAYMDQLRATVFAQSARAPVWSWIAQPTTGHLQGIAAVDGQILSTAHITLVRDGTWIRDLSTSYDGWYGAVDLAPGTYTVTIRNPANDHTNVFSIPVRAGLVTSGP